MDENFSANEFKEKAKRLLDFIPIDYIFAAACAAFCFGGFLGLISTAGTYKDINFSSALSLPIFLVAIVIVFAFLIFISVILKRKNLIPLALLICSLLFGCALAFKGCVIGDENASNIYMNIGIGFVMFLITAWICKDDKLNLCSVSLPKQAIRIVAVFGIATFTIAVSAASIARYNAYLADNFDLGIFTQMFENMRTTGLADTTVERNKLMSHFGVHFSPFYYLLLPIYMLCPRPETILVIQAAFVAIGIIPVMLICKSLKLSNSITVMFGLIYIFFPSLANGCLYDFHENKFLTVLILWALYFIVNDNVPGTLIFCALTLTVKEDAAIYIMAIALYIIISRKKYTLGGCIMAAAIVYFIIASAVIAQLGDGIMTDRLENYMADGEDGFGAVIKNCLTNFGYFMSQIFTKDKIMFMVWMFLPVAFAPFLSKNKSILVLLIPMLAVDLMSNWQFQYDIGFQYTYGVAALIIFMTILVIYESKEKTRNKILMFSLSMSIIMSFSLFIPRCVNFIDYAFYNAEIAEGYDELIASIPTDAEISADGYYIAHMYNFTNIYQYPNYYDDDIKTEYMLVNGYYVENNYNNLKKFMGDDYKLIAESGDMQLYRLKEAK